MSNVPEQYMAYSILATGTLVVHILVRPFKDERLYYFELVAETILLIISIVLTPYKPPYSEALSIVIFFLIVPFFFILLIYILRERFLTFKQIVQSKYPKKQSQSDCESPMAASASNSLSPFPLSRMSFDQSLPRKATLQPRPSHLPSIHEDSAVTTPDQEISSRLASPSSQQTLSLPRHQHRHSQKDFDEISAVLEEDNQIEIEMNPVLRLSVEQRNSLAQP